MEKARSKGITIQKFFLDYRYAATGHTNESLRVIEQLKTTYEKGLGGARRIAIIYSGLGDKAQVFAWLGRAAPDPGERVRRLKDDPAWDEVTSDPRYAALLKKYDLDK